MSFKKILLFSLLTTSSLMAADSDRILRQLKDIEFAVKDVGGLSKALSCALTPTLSESDNTQKKTILHSALNKKDIPLSVVSLNEAKALFNAAYEDYQNDFSNPLDFCFARAHRVNQFLEEEKGIISGKAFLEGEFFLPTNILDLKEIGWFYHTASIVMVEHNGKTVPYVFDHVLYDRPVPYQEWKKRITGSPKSKLSGEYFTDRFVYNRQDKMNDLREWIEEDTFDMNAQLKSGQRQSHMLDLGPKNGWFK